MALFTLICRDKPNASDLRMATREAHLAYVDDNVAMVKMAGPLLTDEGQMAGSLFVLEAEDRAAAEAFAANDPYGKAGLFASTEVNGFKVVRGSLG